MHWREFQPAPGSPLSLHVMLKLEEHVVGKARVLVSSAAAAIHRTVTSQSSGAQKSWIGMLARLVPGEDSLPTFLLCLRTAFPWWCARGEADRPRLRQILRHTNGDLSSYKSRQLYRSSAHPGSLFRLNYLNAPSPQQSPRGPGLQQMNLGDHNSVYTRCQVGDSADKLEPICMGWSP